MYVTVRVSNFYVTLGVSSSIYHNLHCTPVDLETMYVCHCGCVRLVCHSGCVLLRGSANGHCTVSQDSAMTGN